MSDMLQRRNLGRLSTGSVVPALLSAAVPAPALAGPALVSALLLGLASPLAHAQQAERAATAPTLPTVDVTGSREPAPALDQPASTGSRLGLTPLQTPASIEVIGSKTLRDRGDDSLIEASSRAAGLVMNPAPGNGGTAMGARGFLGHGSVMQLYDGTRFYMGAGTVTFPFDVWFADRVEILRGAASVLYGEGAIGAAVNFVPKKPVRGPIRNEARLAWGSDNTRHLALGSAGAIDDRWSYRFDVSHRGSDGFMARGDSKSTAFGGALRLDLTPDLQLTLSHDQGHREPTAWFGVPLIDGRLDSRNRHQNYNVADAIEKYRDRWTRLDAEWTPTSRLRLRNQVYFLDSRRHWRNTEAYSWNADTGLIDRDDYLEIAHRQEQVGNRFDVTWTHDLFGRENTLTAGFDVNRIRFRHLNDSPYGGFSVVDPFVFDPGVYESPAVFSARYQTRTQTRSLFLEDRLVLDERWSVVAGLRRDHAEVDRADLVNSANNFDKTFDYTTGRIGVVFQPSPDQSVYAQWARAVDPLGGLISTSATQAQFDLTTGRQLEIGFKQLLAERRGAWTVALFQIEKNKLLSRSEENPAVQQQIGKQSSLGLEATIDYAFTPTLKFQGNVTRLRARYDDFKESVGGSLVNRDGNTPTGVPETLANAWLDWQFLPRWRALAGVRHVGPRPANTANTREIGSYTVVDGSVHWDLSRDLGLGLQLYNILDRDYPLAVSNGGNQWILGRPRTVMLSADFRF